MYGPSTNSSNTVENSGCMAACCTFAPGHSGSAIELMSSPGLCSEIHRPKSPFQLWNAFAFFQFCMLQYECVHSVTVTLHESCLHTFGDSGQCACYQIICKQIRSKCSFFGVQSVLRPNAKAFCSQVDGIMNYMKFCDEKHVIINEQEEALASQHKEIKFRKKTLDEQVRKWHLPQITKYF